MIFLSEKLLRKEKRILLQKKNCLRAIFGDKAGDVKDASLKVSPSVQGVVVDKKLFSRTIKDRKAKAEEKTQLEEVEGVYNKELEALKSALVDKLFSIVSGKTSQGVLNNYKEEIIPKGTKFTH